MTGRRTCRRVRACRRACVPWAAALATLALTACGRPAPVRQTVTFGGPTMGTTWSVQVVTGPEGLATSRRAELDRSIRTVLDRINRLMSTWDPTSELSRFNDSDQLGPFVVAPETFEVFQWAQRLAHETDGAIDVTVGPLVTAWGFGPDGESQGPPTEEALARRREAVGMQHLELDPHGKWVRKRQRDVRCDFSSLAPGYAADRIAATLGLYGLTDFLVDVGGEFVARGSNDNGRPWHVGVEQPGDDDRWVARVIPLVDQALATSGDYRHYREVDGERLPHILDPRSGRPIRHRLSSVTVVDRMAVRADGLATAMMVLGPEDGMALAERLALPVLFILRTPEGRFEQRLSSQLETMLREE